MKACRRVEAALRILNQVLSGCNRSALPSGHLNTDIHCIRCWLGPRKSVDAVVTRKNPFPKSAGNGTPVVQPVV